MEIRIRVQTCALERGAPLCIGLGAPGFPVRGEAHRQESRASQEVPPVQPQSLFDFVGNPVAGTHRTTCLPRASAMVVAARLIAVWTR